MLRGLAMNQIFCKYDFSLIAKASAQTEDIPINTNDWHPCCHSITEHMARYKTVASRL